MASGVDGYVTLASWKSRLLQTSSTEELKATGGGRRVSDIFKAFKNFNMDPFAFRDFAAAAGLPDTSEQSRIAKPYNVFEIKMLLKQWFASIADVRSEVEREKFRAKVASGIAALRNAFTEQNLEDIRSAFMILRDSQSFFFEEFAAAAKLPEVTDDGLLLLRGWFASLADANDTYSTMSSKRG
jgi:hypothetical protein